MGLYSLPCWQGTDGLVLIRQGIHPAPGKSSPVRTRHDQSGVTPNRASVTPAARTVQEQSGSEQGGKSGLLAIARHWAELAPGKLREAPSPSHGAARCSGARQGKMIPAGPGRAIPGTPVGTWGASPHMCQHRHDAASPGWVTLVSVLAPLHSLCCNIPFPGTAALVWESKHETLYIAKVLGWLM